MSEDTNFPQTWAGITGDWQLGLNSVRYLGSNDPYPHGILIGPESITGTGLATKTISTTITFFPEALSGQVLLSYISRNARYVTAGLGGDDGQAYSVSEFVPGEGWSCLESAGTRSYLVAERSYKVEVQLDGRTVRLLVDQVPVLIHTLNRPLENGQVGLFATGPTGIVEFGTVEVSTRRPTAFVVIQYTDRFDSLFEDVIQPVCDASGVEAYRASDIDRPGVIIQDIIQGLEESQIIVAEITPGNPNVYYELGFAHALRKPAILLADRETKLPFDISGHRVIFFDNTIHGKAVWKLSCESICQTLSDSNPSGKRLL